MGSMLRYRAAAIAALLATATLTATEAGPDTRTLKLYNLHTSERLTVTYKQNGRYVPEALSRLNQFTGDWRRKESINMDPVLFDLLWTVYQDSGATGDISIVCGYRSPETNSMLRRRSKGVAKNSQHTRGKAMDFSIPGVPLDKLRSAGLRLQIGGVGYYPASGSPFVHMDTGSVRHWPRMTREQLVRIFPDGRTLHIPSDGKPLPGYELALAEYKARGAISSRTVVASAGPAHPGSSEAIAALAGNRSFTAFDNGAGRRLVRTETTREPLIATPAAALAPAAVPASEPVVVAAATPLPRPAPDRAFETLILEPDPMVVASTGAASRRYMLVGKATPGKSIAQRVALGFDGVAASEPEERTLVMAFASPGEDTADRDPLHLMRGESRTAPARKPRQPAAAPAPITTAALPPREPARPAAEWRDPMARLVFVAAEADWGRSLWTVNTSTRHRNFAELMMPDPEVDPSILAAPARVIAGGFSARPYEGLRTDHFAGVVVQPVSTVDFAAPRRFAALIER